jgi:prophage antirepressor-like protein
MLLPQLPCQLHQKCRHCCSALALLTLAFHQRQTSAVALQHWLLQVLPALLLQH